MLEKNPEAKVRKKIVNVPDQDRVLEEKRIKKKENQEAEADQRRRKNRKKQGFRNVIHSKVEIKKIVQQSQYRKFSSECSLQKISATYSHQRIKFNKVTTQNFDQYVK